MLTILIVDDEKLERHGIRLLLNREQILFKTLEASNGREALEVLQNNEVDILFTDIKMPHMTGLELAEKAKKLYPKLPVILFSGYNDFSYARQAILYGVEDYVVKPVDPQEFHTTLTKVLKKIEKE